MKLELKQHQPSKIINPRIGKRPAVEKTEGEKIRIAKAFLERRFFVVLSQLITKKEVAEYLGCSNNHVDALSAQTDFPKPFDISSKSNSISSRKQPRWRIADIESWLNNKKSGDKNHV